MHDTALEFAAAFFDTYTKDATGLKIVDIGALDVNGSLKSVIPPNNEYVGVDFAEGKGVDVVITDPYALPFANNSIDVCACSSCFEHSEFFWLVFNEILRILKPEGILYLNVPSNGDFHRYPVDCWRFYPDSGIALQNWGRRNGYNTALLESFTGRQRTDVWNDFVAVFVKDEKYVHKYPNRIKGNITHTNGLSYEHAAVWGGDEEWKANAKRDFTNFSEKQEDQRGKSALQRTWTRIVRRWRGSVVMP